MSSSLPRFRQAIRLFLSSTFSDMENERAYFNDILAPKLQAMCRDKGLSFIHVDLRWGISEQDIRDNRLIPMCLHEIECCRPFFLGIIGNRYGSRASDIPEELFEVYPWLREERDKSYTELEMRFHFLNDDKSRYSLFLFKNNTAADATDDAEALASLRSFIRESAPDRIRNYTTIEEFGDIILSQFSEWLGKEYGCIDIHNARDEIFLQEISRHAVHNPSEEESIESCIRRSPTSVFLHGSMPTGKTTLLNHIAEKFSHRIVINCSADEANRDWLFVMRRICQKLSEENETIHFNTDGLHEALRSHNANALLTDAQSAALAADFEQRLRSLSCVDDTVLIINDLEYILGNETAFLQWLPVETSEHFHIVCSSNNQRLLDSAGMIGWTLLEMSPLSAEQAKATLDSTLKQSGKGSLDTQALLRSPLAGYPGYLQTAIHFLNTFGNFQTISLLCEMLSEAEDFRSLYDIVFSYIRRNNGDETAQDIRLALGIAGYSVLPLDEATCYALLRQINGCNAVRWSRVSTIMSAMRFLGNDYTLISSLQNYMHHTLSDKEKTAVHNALGNHYLMQIRETDLWSSASARTIAKAALTHFTKSGNTDSLTSMLDDCRILLPLCVGDRDHLRAALATVMLHSSANPIKRLLQIAEDVTDDPALCGDHTADVLTTLFALYSDLLMKKDSRELTRTVNTAVSRKQIDSEVPFTQNTFVIRPALHQEALAAIQKRGTEAVLTQFKELIDSEKDPILKAIYANTYADLLLKLRHHDALPDIERALTLATRAAHIPSILCALEMQIVYLVRDRRFEQAQDLARSSADRALDIGYLPLYVACMQQRIVCLYRTEQFEEARRLADDLLNKCRQWGAREHAAVFQSDIAMILTLSGKDRECITFVQNCLKDKTLPDSYVLQLTNILKAAYSNVGDFDAVRSCLTKALKHPALDDTHRLYFSLSLAITLYLLGESNHRQVLSYLDTVLQLAQKNRNRPLAMTVLQLLAPLFFESEAGYAVWLKWKHSFGDNDVLAPTLCAISEDAMISPRILSDVHTFPRTKANVRKLQSRYDIAVERGNHTQAAELALRLALLTPNEPNTAVSMYCRAAQAFKDAAREEDCRNAALRGLLLTVHHGVVHQKELFDVCCSYFTPVDLALLEQWQAVPVLLETDHDAAVELLHRLFSAKDTSAQLRSACLEDLSEPLLEALTPREFVELLRTAEANGVHDTVCLQQQNLAAGHAAREFFRFFRTMESQPTSSAFETLVLSDKRFRSYRMPEIEGMKNYALTSLASYKHIDHTFTTVSLVNAQQFNMSFTTSIVLRSLSETERRTITCYIQEHSESGRDGTYMSLPPSDPPTVKLFTILSKPLSLSLKTDYRSVTDRILQIADDLDRLLSET